MTDRTMKSLALVGAVALALTPIAASANTRAGDDAKFYSPSVALKSGLQRAPEGEDEGLLGDIPIWTIAGGVTLLTLIALAIGSGNSNSRSGSGFQSNGAN